MAGFSRIKRTPDPRIPGVNLLCLTIMLLPVTLDASTCRGADIALTVDATLVRHLIPDEIYGMNFAAPELAAELRLGVNRWGGNATTRYSYLHDTANRGSDWYFENIPDSNEHPEDLPHGSAADTFVAANQGNGTQSILTIPLIGWTPKARGYDCGYAVEKYGAQQKVDVWRPCGNGILPDGTPITWNDPGDTSVAATAAFVSGWVQHLVSVFGTADQGGVRFYNLDNEPMLWPHTHRDVHPAYTSYDELRDRTYTYAAAVKAADPAAQTLGPVVWGWMAYFWSALDTQNGYQDRANHGGMAFIPWYLQQMQLYESQNSTRILDYLDLHYYPQATGVTLSNAGSTATQQLRLRSTRSLWDPTYRDESWISDTTDEGVMLLPRMQAWINSYYPGTRLAITEYNWGGLEHLNGALTQADVLGIFGEFGLHLATLWSPPATSQPGAFAFRMYRNYDGLGGRFGEQSVLATSSKRDDMAVYAARRGADKALTIMVINKTGTPQSAILSLAGGGAAQTCEVYRYSGASLGAISHQADIAVVDDRITALFPAQSITMLTLPFVPRQGDVNGDTRVDLSDAVTALQVMAGLEPSADSRADINQDGAIGMAEAIAILTQMAR